MASKFKKKIVKEYEDKGYLVLLIIRLNKNAFPDLLCLKKNEPNLWVEVKEANDTLKPIQKVRIDQLNKIGNKAICIQDGKGIIYPNGRKEETFDI